MPATPEADARTRAFARVIGPYVALVTAVIIIRIPAMASGAFLNDIFASDIHVWILGTGLLLGGLIIVANHQLWHRPAAVMISLFGWFLALRGLLLLVAPGLVQRGVATSLPKVLPVQLGFGLLTLMGLYLSYVGWIAPVRRRD